MASVSATARCDPPPSSTNGTAKPSTIEFVSTVTREGSAGYVSPEKRIATFDDDGTLESEQPVYFQLFYIISQIKKIAPEHPEWKSQEPLASVLKGGLNQDAVSEEYGLINLLPAIHQSMTSVQFFNDICNWLVPARHPRPESYKFMIFQAMLELLNYLHANGMKTSIVPGNDVDFVRLLRFSCRFSTSLRK